MPGEDTLCRALLGLLGLVAVSAVVVGGLGVYTVLTRGTTDGDVERDVIGEFACEGFDGDPEVAHEAGYDIELTVKMRDENRLAVEADTATPVRVWVDTVSEDATVTRTRLDVSPTS